MQWSIVREQLACDLRDDAYACDRMLQCTRVDERWDVPTRDTAAEMQQQLFSTVLQQLAKAGMQLPHSMAVPSLQWHAAMAGLQRRWAATSTLHEQRTRDMLVHEGEDVVIARDDKLKGVCWRVPTHVYNHALVQHVSNNP
eukprot:208833-Lingulodinium_polyedra.AAC.1